MIVDDPPVDEVLLDDPLEDRRIALPVPRTVGIDDGDRAAFADAEAVRLGPQNSALLGETERFQPRLEIVPGREAAILVAALRLRLIATEKDVSPGDRNANTARHNLLGAKPRTHWNTVATLK